MEPYTESGLRHTFRRLARAANIPDKLQFRDIRRTVLTDLANHGHRQRDDVLQWAQEPC